MLSTFAFGVLLLGAEPLRFEKHLIDHFPAGYQVAVADLNGDGRPDVIALSTDADRVDWYENPGWQRHPVARTAKNIDLAVRDLDGTGRPVIALASGFYFNESSRGGEIQLLRQPAKADDLWLRQPIAVDPVVHRLRWGDLEGNGRPVLIHAPIFGPGSQGTQAPKPAHLRAFRPPRQADRPWEVWKIDESLTVLHGICIADLDGDGRDEILTASFEGIHRFDFKGQGQAARWRKIQLARGAPPVNDKPGAARGTSEVAVLHLAKGRLMLAAIEPWHGHQVVVYSPPEGEGLWHRRVIDDTLQEGHALVTADFDGDGQDEIVAGWRAGGGGLRLYKATDATGRDFKSYDLDPGMPAEGAVVADINADGKLDLVVIGGRKNQLVWYENLTGPALRPVRAEPAQGIYFAKKQYVPKPLPKFAETKGKLPSPIYDENPLYVQMYWKTWELGFRNFYEPKPGSGFVSQFIDAAFNENIFLWDTCFMTMFCNYGHPLVPGICSLDNFYAKQYEDGEICREINRTTGRDYVEWVNREQKDLFSRWGRFSVAYTGREVAQSRPHLTLDALNHPIFAWAELESVRVTGDRSRLKLVYEPLVRYCRALQEYIRQGSGLYVTDWASMDNSPRNLYLEQGGTAVDTSSQMVLFGNQLAEIADLLGKKDEAGALRKEAAELARIINEKMWNPERKFYFDLTADGKQAPAKTVAAFWTLLAGVASAEQADALAAELRNPQSFGRQHRVPSTPADQSGFDPAGGYWRGSVWPSTNTMVIRGLERYGKHDLAREIALEHLRMVGEVFRTTGTVWENYASDAVKPGKPAKGDLVGWTGIVPILYFLEYGIGLRADAPNNRLAWLLTSTKRCGCERFRFNGHTATLVAQPPNDPSGLVEVTVESDGQFQLWVERGGKRRDFNVKAGKNRFTLD